MTDLQAILEEIVKGNDEKFLSAGSEPEMTALRNNVIETTRQRYKEHKDRLSVEQRLRLEWLAIENDRYLTAEIIGLDILKLCARGDMRSSESSVLNSLYLLLIDMGKSAYELDGTRDYYYWAGFTSAVSGFLTYSIEKSNNGTLSKQKLESALNIFKRIIEVAENRRCGKEQVRGFMQEQRIETYYQAIEAYLKDGTPLPIIQRPKFI